MARRRSLPEYVDTVIVGGGPASLILSYILHGRIPHYVGRHYDDLLHARLSQSPDLLNIAPETYAHFSSSLRYSTQALPLNTLLDTLIRPNADTEINPKSCIEWRGDARRAISHVVLTAADGPGGQWVDNPVDASWDIGTLSYSEMLSLPGYTYEEHYRIRHGKEMPDFERPSRSDVADYFRAYPEAVAIDGSIFTSTNVDSISRTSDGFLISPHGIYCKHLVLATGIFSTNITPNPQLAPLATLHSQHEPILVIGSGFSAADVIISTSPHRKIIHIYKWQPDTKPSPLRGCHHQAYPEYAGVYRQMKLAALANKKRPATATSPLLRRKSNPFFSQRDWCSVYEGLPNAQITEVRPNSINNTAIVKVQLESGEIIERTVGQLAYVVGRRGTLSYLSPPLRDEVIPLSNSIENVNLISGRTLRPKVEHSFEVAPDVFVVGSLAGDSLVRHAFGGCVAVAGSIMGVGIRTPPLVANGNGYSGVSVPSSPLGANGVAHEDLHVDRREDLRMS